MKKYLLILSLLVATVSCFGQDSTDDSRIDNLVRLGIQYHDNGEYDKAIEVYKEALQIDPESALVHYELAMTYSSAGEHENAIRHSDIVIQQETEEEYLLLAYTVKGSALDDLGQTEQAIELYREALAQFGDNYLLYFNLAVSYGRMQDYKNAEEAYINAIMHNPGHASSHYGLAIIKAGQHQRVQSLLSLYYFLLLETHSERSETAYAVLMEQLGGNARDDGNNPMDTNSSANPAADAEFDAVEKMFAMLEASNASEENKDKTPEDLFIQNTQSFFTLLREQFFEHKGQLNIWWVYYVPLFSMLAESEYMDVFCYYISLSSNEKAGEWLMKNRDKFERFHKWINEQ